MKLLRSTPTVSVIVPTWNEASTIEGCLSALAPEAIREVIVADASSPDETAAIARRLGITVVDAPRGRAAQQNRGAVEARGDVLLFLHADCRLDRGAIDELRGFLARNPRSPGGFFRMRVAARGLAYRMIDAAAHLRAGVLNVPYGDQALFVRRSAFDRVGGFPSVDLMEDVMIALRLRTLGRLALMRRGVEVSARRWIEIGVLQQSLRNWGLTALVASGIPPDRLSHRYPAVRGLRTISPRETCPERGNLL